MRWALAALPLLLLPGLVHADALDNVERDLRKLEADAQNLRQGLKARKQPDPDVVAERRLVEAQVAYGTANYDDATILLYDIVEKRQRSRAYPDAVFYLADSLFHKRDFVSSRKHFRVIVYDLGERSPHYQKALERLLELSLVHEDADVNDYLARIDRIPEGNRIESVPYMRGKFAYFREDYDQAIRILSVVQKASAYYFQAQYFLGAAYIQKGELASSAKVFHGLLREPISPRPELAEKQHRIIELTHLALGRIHYRYAQDLDDEPRKQEQEALEAVSHYLMVPRRSDLFDDALYEVAFVYVQIRKFDKALRALELLEMTTGGTCEDESSRAPTAHQMPEICILKGNLQIRKAQALSQAGNADSPLVFSSAVKVFSTTRDAYTKPRDDLKAILARNEDPKQFFAQITEQSRDTFTSDVTLPDVAVRWVREQPMVRRILATTNDLVEIRREMEAAEETLERLERAVNSPSRANLDPDLAMQRTRAYELLEELTTRRLVLVQYEGTLANRLPLSAEDKAELARAAERRRVAEKRLAALPGSGDRYGERVKRARAKYDDLAKQAQKIEVFIGSLEAEIRAIERYYRDTREKQQLSQEDYEQMLREAKAQIAALRTELEAIRKELALATDAAGIYDELAVETQAARADLDAAILAEHVVLRRVIAKYPGDARARSDRVDAAFRRIAAIEQSVVASNERIDQIIDAELADERVAIAEEKARLVEFKKELEAVEAENLSLGSEIIYGSFEDVSKSFYEITVRAEVGVVDVTWAQKEEAENNYRQIDVESRREKVILENEFPEIRRVDTLQPTPSSESDGESQDQPEQPTEGQ